MKKLSVTQVGTIGSANIKLSIFLIIVFLSFCRMQALPAAEDISKFPLVLQVSGMEQIQVTKNVIYKEAGSEKLVADIYYPQALKQLLRLSLICFPRYLYLNV